MDNRQPEVTQYYVYYLHDPNNDKVRYVGISKNPKQRFNAHMNPSFSHENTHKTNWINKLKLSGLKPYYSIAYSFESLEDCKDKEIELINTLPNLTNIKGGGDLNDGIVWTEEAKEAQRQRRLSRTYIATHPNGTEETITNMRAFATKHNLTRSLIMKVLQGKRLTHKGFKFKYVK